MKRRSVSGRLRLGKSKKNSKIWRAWVVFLDESGLSQKPPVRRTWAPRGKTPVLRHCFNLEEAVHLLGDRLPLGRETMSVILPHCSGKL